MKCDELKVYRGVDIYDDIDYYISGFEPWEVDDIFTRLCGKEYYLKSKADKAISELKRENERIKKFNAELVKDCKWLYTNHTPEINGFETIVLCTNGKKRVAEFRKFDLRWYDVNNGYKLNVVKWLWQPTMPMEEKK